ncbi:transcription repressor NadR [Metabacillus sediminilitoris]|uniref:Transcription repressor NadR n=1 Tax=Metabacillus sediminilitoris TaxID=2567941 RepID=A0A4S4C2B9_9BACI|nr:transcription repressor NadR [Metabacillus sediminilitoris]QGQ47400.1 HTH domain-containing protein [Metabacillus sediminilitoris]THF81835.1 transcription repressor NadR [Metabacillus sediminilitoris]
MNHEKLSGEDRRTLLLELLSEADKPITGGDLANRTNVSRQVIVQDISLLKAKNYPIIATSQGYVFLKESDSQNKIIERIIACNHAPEQAIEELTMIVDHGVIVKDVIVEHQVYGELTASIMVGNRNDVKEFVKKIENNSAAYLSQLTNGLHLHTLQADSLEKLDRACEELKKAGFLMQE